MQKSSMIQDGDWTPRGDFSYNCEEEGFQNLQFSQQVLQSELTYQQYQRRSKRKARKQKEAPKKLGLSLVKDHPQRTSRQRPNIQLILDSKSRKLPSRNPSLNTPRRQEPSKIKEIRIPIENTSEGVNPTINPRKLVYNGYTPRSSHYYIKTLKQMDYTLGGQQHEIRKDCEVSFNSKFQSGNLHYALRTNQFEYALHIRKDTNTKGQRQWFYFEVCNRRAVKVRFRIYKFTKHSSLYRKGAKPFVISQKTAHKGEQWIQAGDNIRYDYDHEEKCYYLQFDYTFEDENGTTYFASLPPYTYSRLQNLLNTLCGNSYVTKYVLGNSLAGLEIPYIEIKQFSSQAQNRQFIIVVARTHPGETVSNFALEGFIDVVLKHPKLLQKFIFIIVPMLNPDGVFFGNHRTGVLGQDLNRHFDTDDDEFFPEIVALKKLVRSTRRRGKVRFLFDLHGHSSKKGVFAYAAGEDKKSSRFVYSRIIPKLLEKQFSLFDYDGCVFKNSKQKKDTARVHFMLKERITAITFEQSYSMFFDKKLQKNQPIGIKNWVEFGRALAQSLVDYCQLIEGKTDVVNCLRDFMPEEFMESDLDTYTPKTNKSEQPRFCANNVNYLNSTQVGNQMMIRNQTSIDLVQSIYQQQKQSDGDTKTDDSEMEFNEQQLQQFKRNIRQYIRPPLHTQRQSLVLAEKSVQLQELENYRIRNQRVHYLIRPNVPKTFRIQHSLSLRERQRKVQSSKPSFLELPSINKRYL